MSALHKDTRRIGPKRTFSRDSSTGEAVLLVELPILECDAEDSSDLLRHIQFLRYSRSRYILDVKDVTYRSDSILIVMEYPRGGSLRACFDESMAILREYKERELWQLLTQLSEIVMHIGFLYTSNAIHIDPIITPDTLFYDSYGNLQLDLVYSLEYLVRITGRFEPSPQDQNVQRYRDKVTIVNCDVSEACIAYSVGAILYEAILLGLASSMPAPTWPCYVSFQGDSKIVNSISHNSAHAKVLLEYEQWRKFFSLHGLCKESYRIRLTRTPYFMKILECLKGLSNAFTLLGKCIDRIGILKPVLQDIIPWDLNLLLSPHCSPVLLTDWLEDRDTYLCIELLVDELVEQLNIVLSTPWTERERPIIYTELRTKYSQSLLSLLEGMLSNTPEQRTTVATVVTHPLVQTSYHVDTPLMLAAKHGNVRVLTSHLQEYVRRNDVTNNTALIHAVLARQYEAALLLAPYEAGAINADGKNASYYLLNACTNAEPALSETEQEILHKLIPILAVHESQWTFAEKKTLLMLAASANNMAFVEHFAASESTMTDSSSMCSAEYALQSRAKDAFIRLVKREHHLLTSAGYTPLMLSAASNDVLQLKSELETSTASVGKYSPQGYTALMIAAIMQAEQAVEALIVHEARIQSTPSRQTALMLAITLSLEDIALLLTEREGGLKTFTGKTALMYAAERNMIKLVDALINVEAGLKDLQLNTALMLAAISNSSDAAALLLPKEACLLNREGLTALMLAAQRNNVEALRIILPYESSIKSPTGGATALIHSVYCGNVEATKVLARAEPGFKTQSNETSLEIAYRQRRRDLVSIIEEYETFTRHEDGLTPLMIDAIRNDALSIERHIQAYEEDLRASPATTVSSQIGLRDNYGKTALIHAIENSSMEAVTLLAGYELGFRDHSGYCAIYYSLFAEQQLDDELFCRLFDVEKGILEDAGFTPLMLSVLMRNTTVALLQVEHYATISTKDGYTALMLAAILGNIDMVKLLCPLESGYQTNTGYTALMFAVERNDLEIALILAENGRELGLQEKTGWTALMMAAKNGYLKLAALLAPHEYGHYDVMGCTALLRAVQGNHFNVVQILADYEKGLITTDCYPRGRGWTPLFEAIYNGYPNCVAFLIKREVEILNHSAHDLLMCAQSQRSNVPLERRLLCKSIIYEFINQRSAGT
ncbi:Protein 21.1 [Giardia lamblia P15]|uniref:Protein 21.1 n=1 Tax=Giardia intestinalis (strain P15) TaxID=658858 RepID=E1F697_GIAIA|nr:Protein 21.1 [Giardia lamblia P15]